MATIHPMELAVPVLMVPVLEEILLVLLVVLGVPPVTQPVVEIQLVRAVSRTMGSMLLPDALPVLTEHPVRVEAPIVLYAQVV